MTNEKIRSYCNVCNQENWHNIKGSHSYRDYDDNGIHYSVIQCRGCDNTSFLTELYTCYAEETYDGELIPTEREVFPKQHKGNIETLYLPTIVKNIYQETCNAYRDEALTLAGIGFRATIEAICNEQQIKGKELSTRINNLCSKGLLSKKDSERLHAIRFLGNDAAHKIKEPSKMALQAALVIVEHLITTVYILDKKTEALEKIIQEYNEFETLLIKNLKNHKIGDELPFTELLGKDTRLLNGSLKPFEKRLREKIGKGEFKLLLFGQKDKKPKSQEKIQHYIVNKHN